MTTKASSRVRVGYVGVVKWSRRLSALAANALLLRWALSGVAPFEEVVRWLGTSLAPEFALPPERILFAAVIVWYTFLSQLKLRWAVWLPVYLLVFPAAWFLRTVLAFASIPLVSYAKSLSEDDTANVTQPSPRRRRALPLKRLWLVLFFLWLLAVRGLNSDWAAWIPPILAIPIWQFFLKLAYKSAITPRTFVNSIVRLCSALLDRQMNELRKEPAKPENRRASEWVRRAVHGILSRYSEERVLSVIQRESIGLFSATLLAALAASSVFWGLVGQAILRTNPQALDSYVFFNSRGFWEAVLWAWGCMTTTINFPGQAAVMWVKWLHAAILATGLFQLTFLIACFAIMTGSESQRNAQDVRDTLGAARAKLEEARSLEQVAIDVVPKEASPGSSAD